MRREPIDGETRQLIEKWREHYREMRKVHNLSHEEAIKVVLCDFINERVEEALAGGSDIQAEPEDTPETLEWLEDIKKQLRTGSWYVLALDVLTIIAALDGAKADTSA